MNPARRVTERQTMSASRTTRASARRPGRARKPTRATRLPKPVKAVKPVAKLAAPQLVLYRLCRAAWVVTVEKSLNAQGTRFVCPFCPHSHRVPGPVRGFRKVRRAQWVKLRRVEE